MTLLGALALVLATLSQDTPRATVRAEPATVEVGEPVRIEIALRHAPGEQVTFFPERIGGAWIFLGADGTATTAAPDGERVTRVTWTVCALEPLENALPELFASIDGDEAQPLAADGAGVLVVGVLGPDEDEARGPKGFRGAEEVEPRTVWWPFALAAAVALAVVALLLRQRRRAAPVVAAPPTARERLAAIDPEALDDPAAVQAAYYEITSALRSGVDARLGRERGALTDEEWLADTGGHVPAAELDLLADLLRDSAPVKYGSARPTLWGVKETLDRARSALDAEAPRPELETAP
jgi:hypothetical protein